MPIIELQITILAPMERCFDLARSIDIHMQSTTQTNEKAIAGVTSGLIELEETVTWEATHFGIRQRLTSIISELEYPRYFVDEMVSGAFKRIRHEHHFSKVKDGTLMVDLFDYTAPYGILGKIADKTFLYSYMERLLTKRNLYIKEIAESK